MTYFRAFRTPAPEQDGRIGALLRDNDLQVSWGQLLAPVAPGPVALTAQGNIYSFTLTVTNDLITADIEA